MHSKLEILSLDYTKKLRVSQFIEDVAMKINGEKTKVTIRIVNFIGFSLKEEYMKLRSNCLRMSKLFICCTVTVREAFTTSN